MEGNFFAKNPSFKAPSKPIKKRKKKPSDLGLMPVFVFLFSDMLVWGVKEKKHDQVLVQV